MKVRILKLTHETEQLGGQKNKVGAVVEVSGAIGNPMACIGLVEVVEHDKPDSVVAAEMKATPEALEHLERETGKPFLTDRADPSGAGDGGGDPDAPE